jgi:lathosterol oxidase
LRLKPLSQPPIGHGFISGLISALCGITGLGLVLAVRYPQLFGFAELRELRSMAYLQVFIHVTLVASFLLGTLSAWLRTNKTLALVGITFTLAASLLGGSQAAVTHDDGRPAWLGVDFFVLNLLLYSGVFVPLERWFALRADQPVFRRQWPIDLIYFFLNSLLIEVLSLLTVKPVAILFDPVRIDAVSLLPLVVQVPALLLAADFTQYWVHRAFHVSRWLWPFHAIHHSIEQMDWLAGSRLHLVDVILTRGLTYVPIFVLGFSEGALIGVRLYRGGAGHVHSCQREVGLQAAAADRGHPGFPSLASQRRAAKYRQELRGAHAGVGSAVWDLLPAGSMAAGVRARAPARCSATVEQPVRLSVPKTPAAFELRRRYRFPTSPFGFPRTVLSYSPCAKRTPAL